MAIFTLVLTHIHTHIHLIECMESTECIGRLELMLSFIKLYSVFMIDFYIYYNIHALFVYLFTTSISWWLFVFHGGIEHISWLSLRCKFVDLMKIDPETLKFSGIDAINCAKNIHSLFWHFERTFLARVYANQMVCFGVSVFSKRDAYFSAVWNQWNLRAKCTNK